MSVEILYEALGEIQEEFILEAEKTEPAVKKRRILRNLAAACLLLLVMALPVSAEMRTGYISNLLAPVYGGRQTQLVESVGVPLDASVTVGEYTLTADAVIGDRYNIAIVYSLTRVDGGELPEGIRFDEYSGRIWPGGGSYSHELSPDKKTLKVIQQWTSHRRLFWFDRHFHVICKDLVIRDNGEVTLLAQGEWALEFTIRYKDTTTTTPVRNQKVTVGDGREYTIKKLQLSPFSIHMELKVPNPLDFGGEIGKYYDYDIRVKVLLEDGTTVVLDHGSLGYHGSYDKETFKAEYDNIFEEPIPVEQIKGIQVCDTLIPVK